MHQPAPEATSAERALRKRLQQLEGQLSAEQQLRAYRERTIEYLTEDNSEAESDVELVAKNLFDALPHRHPNGCPPQWSAQPQRLRDLFVQAAAYSAGLSTEPPAMLPMLWRLGRAD